LAANITASWRENTATSLFEIPSKDGNCRKSSGPLCAKSDEKPLLAQNFRRRLD